MNNSESVAVLMFGLIVITALVIGFAPRLAMLWGG